ncbi:ATP-binding cassette domain-containing protein [Chryseobacterium sp. HMWF035]|uniref:ATP-binding cassette domain-containing protein n=1 Tax=Chryseobacterium sp. HMWF035 TaxID=2056868 RepID=UPI001E420459|nr:ATP-binding cassette domain-containing protein [Chryseobacterium sp. HMWF035]
MKLKTFNINKLYGYRDIHIDFLGPNKILIGENGLGKTTVLNIIYYTLSKNFEKLNLLNFESIEIIFENKTKVYIQKDVLEKHIKLNKENSGSHFSELLSEISREDEKKIRQIIDDNFSQNQYKRLELQSALKKIGIKINAPANYIFEMIRKHFDEIDGNKFFDEIKKIDENVDCKILYFPTYRRIEEDIKNIGILNKDDVNENFRIKVKRDLFYQQYDHTDIMQFGMSDVEERIDYITNKIAHSSMIGFSDISAEMLHQLLTDFPNVKLSNKKKIDAYKLNIILDRIGPNMSTEDRHKINEYIETGNTDNKGLIFFIEKLTSLYNKQEKQDIAIKKFVEVCNHYLTEKKYVYDEREVKLYIQHENEKYKEIHGTSEVQLKKLSSGEKQIVSLFSKIYLEETDKYIVLFDEPELSLSIFWQQLLLPDIINSRKCDLLIAVTHSPFIFENDLFEYATPLKECISYDNKR